jgi:hypothetical protein
MEWTGELWLSKRSPGEVVEEPDEPEESKEELEPIKILGNLGVRKPIIVDEIFEDMKVN